MEENNKISFFDEDGEEVQFMVIEQTKLSGVNYLLVADSLDDEGTIMILKETDTEDGYVSYEIVEDEKELEVISKIFNELVEEFDLMI